MDYLQEAQEAQAVSGIKTHKVLWFIFFGIIFVIIFLIVYLVFAGGHKNVSNNKLVEGTSVEVGEDDSIKFQLDEEDHGIKIDFVGLDSVDLTLSSEPIKLNLKIDEVKEVDLNNDGVVDLRVKLVKIVDGKATIAIQKIEKEACQESWECSQWSDCSNGVQTRECDDSHSCSTTFYKPSEEKECLEIEFIENDSAFRNTTNNSINNSVNNNLNNSVNTSLNNTNILNTTIINCGTTSNYTCFINASKTCHPAKWTLSHETSLFGVTSYSTTYFEIKGYSSDGKCIYYEKYLSGNLVYTDALVHDLLQQGYTSEQVAEMQSEAQASMNYVIGTEKICKFNQANLTKLLTKWQGGSYSNLDYEGAECYPHASFDCKLDFAESMQVTGISITSIDSVSQSITMSVKGFSNSSKIYWRVENSSVIRLYPLVGSHSKIYPLKVGKTIIVIKDTSLTSCELRTSFEVFWEDSYDIPTCDNDSKCEWDDDETISNCPHDCIGNSNFFSNHTCEWNEDCYDEYPLCVLNTCAKPTQALKNFIEENYETGNCSAISCNHCQLGKLHPTGIGYYEFELDFCAECSKESTVFPCKQGYICEKGLCISSNTSNSGIIVN
ncbi:MAG: hypothetical protein NTZ83_00210 [Candidatus Pacearchaeota archaeon]|nr:hypothetical protein [Candidatus Pacearchaeota archaeon]